jgi:hypothetical protein
MSPKNIEHMTSHHSQDVVDGVMVHIFYGEACKQFNKVYPQFLMEPRNIYVCLYTYRFNLFGSFAVLYSCWLVIHIVYNLPPRMCIRSEFIFLYMVVPGSNSPSRNIDVSFRSLFDELNQLWSSRIFYVWCLKEIRFSDEGSFNVDYQWFYYVWEGFWLKHMEN